MREVVTQSAGLTFNDARTSDPGRYSELGLADTGDGGGKEIVFRAGNGDIADIVVGNNDNTAGSAGGGQFVRIKGQPQTWLARGTVRVPANRTGWYANVDFDTKRSEIKKVTLSGGAGETVTIASRRQEARRVRSRERAGEARAGHLQGVAASPRCSTPSASRTCASVPPRPPPTPAASSPTPTACG